ncbi:MAG: hypothetical protein H6739_02400 [Alphaproteobacteria bacterium]|nr:hypothetical protein [Alphaproteobacteria bacterium]
MILLTCLTAALAADPSVYARQTTLELPPAGPALIGLDDAQLWQNRDDLLLLDAEGRAVPWVIVGSWQDQLGRCERVAWDPVGRPPYYERVRIDTRSVGRTVNRLRIGSGSFHRGIFSGGAFAMDVAVYEGDRKVAEGLLWRANIAHQERENYEIQLPNLPPGVYDVVAPDALRWRDLEVCWTAQADVRPLSLDLSVEGPEYLASGTSSYTIPLPAAGLELTELELEVSDPRFDRSVEVYSPAISDSLALSMREVGDGPIERLSLGGATLDHTRLPLRSSGLGDRLELRILDGRDPALKVTGATATARNRQLLVLDAGPGPHTLYAAPATPDPASHDLGHAIVELLREDPPRITPASWRPNPGYNPAAVMPQALLRGAAADISGYEASRALTAPQAGLPTRWTLPPELLAVAGGGLTELRIVDAEGFQVPYVIDRVDRVALETTVSRVEEAGRSRLKVTLPFRTRPTMLRLETDSSVFSRRVAVVGSSLNTTWVNGPDDGRAVLYIDLREQVTDTLELLVSNGDDQPLGPISAKVWAPAVSVVAVAPEGGATLWYGKPSVGRPDYDLSMLSALLVRGELGVGTVGPEVLKETSSPVDRTVGMVGVGVLALALVGLVLMLLRDPDREAPDGEPG